MIVPNMFPAEFDPYSGCFTAGPNAPKMYCAYASSLLTTVGPFRYAWHGRNGLCQGVTKTNSVVAMFKTLRDIGIDTSTEEVLIIPVSDSEKYNISKFTLLRSDDHYLKELPSPKHRYLVYLENRCYHCYNDKQVRFLHNNATGNLIYAIYQEYEEVETKVTAQPKNTPNWIVYRGEDVPDIAGGYCVMKPPTLMQPSILLSNKECELFQVSKPISITNKKDIEVRVKEDTRVAIVAAHSRTSEEDVTIGSALKFNYLTVDEAINVFMKMEFTSMYVVYYTPICRVPVEHNHPETNVPSLQLTAAVLNPKHIPEVNKVKHASLSGGRCDCLLCNEASRYKKQRIETLVQQGAIKLTSGTIVSRGIKETAKATINLFHNGEINPEGNLSKLLKILENDFVNVESISTEHRDNTSMLTLHIENGSYAASIAIEYKNKCLVLTALLNGGQGPKPVKISTVFDLFN